MAILDQVKEQQIKEALRAGRRVDGRDSMQYRDIVVQKGILPNAEGSALVNIGNTKVVAGVKFDLATPFADRPNEGALICNAEFSTLADPEFESGPPNENAIELARVVDRGIRHAESVNVKEFFLEEGKVLGLFIDMYIIDNFGNLIDTAALAAAAALRDAKVPKYEDGKIVRGDYKGHLKIARDAVACSFEKIDGKLLLDCTDDEQIASSGRFTLTTGSDKAACSAQKSGEAGFTQQEILAMLEESFKQRSKLLKQVV
ncbi:MAG TPA: hypothetical protein VGQ00_04740 [Candidatus Norongarragalinales archaeon]|jgi:exosome complex component RRP42|nr:hypothetical protein [Candidatus Norongarragalinales archaeon]